MKNLFCLALDVVCDAGSVEDRRTGARGHRIGCGDRPGWQVGDAGRGEPYGVRGQQAVAHRGPGERAMSSSRLSFFLCTRYSHAKSSSRGGCVQALASMVSSGT